MAVTRNNPDWDHVRRNARSAEGAPGWPDNVRALTLTGLDLLGIDETNQLYWDGAPIVVRRRLDLTFWQKVWAVIAALAIVLGGIGSAAQGINAGFDFGCKVHWLSKNCK